MQKSTYGQQWLGCIAVGSVLATGAFCTARAQTASRVPGDPITTNAGKVSGTILPNGVYAYLGVPFAAPPVGDLRWHAPAPVKPWTDVYQASELKSPCAQKAFGAEGEKPSEDCLYLNVWVPPTAKPGAKLPVLVFIYGGGFAGGSASSPGYAGAELAKNKNVIRVNIAYRVGIFGYFALPELSDESGHHASGDWGSLDQVAGLQWVQRNIAAFGGDPANVTLFGQSAGSESVYQLQASPLGRGLFAKVSGWSGADVAPGGQVPRSLAEGEGAGLKVEHGLNFTTVAELRAVPWEKLLTDLATLSGPQQGPGGGLQTRPIVDGYFLPDVPENIFRTGKENDVPNFQSSTLEDLGSAMTFYDNVHTVADLQKVGKEAFGDNAEEFSKLFPASNDEEARKVALLVSGDTGFGISNRDWARGQALVSAKPVYLAQWAHVPPPSSRSGGPNFGKGPSHGSDITYWMGNFPAHPERAWTAWDRELSNQMQDLLVAFARTGNPNTSGVRVPRYDPKNEERVVFGDTIYVDKLNTSQIEFLRAHVPKRQRPGGPGGPGGPNN